MAKKSARSEETLSPNFNEAASSLVIVADEFTEDVEDMPERLCSPYALRGMHSQFCDSDRDSSANRAKVQELVDFVPPWDQAERDAAGQGDRFNVNWGLVASIKNEAVGAYLDIWSSPTSVVGIKLEEEVADEMKPVWEGIMSNQFTRMIRSWDASTAQMLLIADIFVTHGVAIPWFDDKSNLFFQVGSLEDFKMDDQAVAIPSKIEVVTIERDMRVNEIYEKIEGELDAEWTDDGWNVGMVKQLLANAKPHNLAEDDGWNFERTQRRIKANRTGTFADMPVVSLIWAMVQELDGRISVYACAKEIGEEWRGDADLSSEEKEILMEGEPWVFRKRFEYDDPNQFMQIFAFGVGNKNVIHTIRGLAYFLYEAGNADNILRCKLFDAARANSTEVYQAQGGTETAEDLTFVDVGHCLIAPEGLKHVPQTKGLPLDQSIGVALDAAGQVLDRHSGGLASNSLLDNPAARRNELQVAAELDHINKMLSFAISLFYTPYDNLMRELVRRAFTENQSNYLANKLVTKMKDACVKQGVPEEMFSRIDLSETAATRVSGAGSKANKVTQFSQLNQMYPEMDPVGQEYFAYDFAVQIAGIDAAEKYFGLPGVRRDHIDVSLIQLENARLKEGDFLDPIEGENKMLHLMGHVEELEVGLVGVDEGQVDIGQFAVDNAALYKHAADTLQQTTVHETRMPELNLVRQRLQQIGEIMENGFRHLEKLRRQGQPLPGNSNGGGDPEADPAMQEEMQKQMAFEAEEGRKQQEFDLKMQRMFLEGFAKVELLKVAGEAKMDLERMKAMADIQAKDALTASDIARARLAKTVAKPSSK